MEPGIAKDGKFMKWSNLVRAGLVRVDGDKLVSVDGNLQGSLTVDSSIKLVCREAFCNCMYLTDIVLPYTCTAIGDLAFKNCKRLKSFKLPACVEKIGRVIFFKCHELRHITVDMYNDYYETGDTENAIVDKTTGTLVAGCFNTKIGNNVNAIGQGAFNGCKNLMDIYIPARVNRIDSFAFANCINLEDVSIASMCATVMGSAFAGCNNLTEIMIHKGCTVANNAFDDCTRVIVVDKLARKEDFGGSIEELVAF